MDNPHFTYNSDFDKQALCQGDLLEKTEELDSVLRSYHSYYAEDKYTHFIVLTQSCDLVRRQADKCKSRYISLAAVRNLSDVLEREIVGKLPSVSVDDSIYCSDRKKESAKDFLRKLVNNNHSDYFFLKSSVANGLNHDSCAFLHLSIAIKSTEHYEKCLQAKTLELTENFRAKLGWLVGQLYSRVGTEDYVPGAVKTDEELKIYLEKLLDDHVLWVPGEIYPQFQKAAKVHNKFDKIQELAVENIEKSKHSKYETLAKKMIKEVDSLGDDSKEELLSFFKSDAGSRLLKSVSS